MPFFPFSHPSSLAKLYFFPLFLPVHLIINLNFVVLLAHVFTTVHF